MNEKDEIIIRISNWFRGKKVPPFMLEIWPTFHCNLKCIYCWRRIMKNVKQKITLMKYLEIVEEAGGMGIKRMEIAGGGEPMISPHIMELMSSIKESGMVGSMTTNGTLFNEDRIKKTVEMEWDLIAISLDAPDSQTNDYLRGVNGCFKRVIKTLKLFKKWKKKLNVNRPKIIFVPVLSNVNYDKIIQFFNLAVKYGVENVDFKPLITYDSEKIKRFRLKEEEVEKMRKLIDEVFKIVKGKKIHTTLQNFLDSFFALKGYDIIGNIERNMSGHKGDPIHKIPCFKPWYFMKVYAEHGMAGPCLVPHISHMEDVKEKSLKEIWYGKKSNHLREEMLRGNVPEFCKKCCGGAIIDNRKIKDGLSKTLKG